MGLDRKDWRFKLDADKHARLKLITDHDDMDDGEWVEQLVLREMERRELAARKEASLIAAFDRLDGPGKNRDSSGNP